MAPVFKAEGSNGFIGKPGKESHLTAELGILKSLTLCKMGKAMSAHGTRLLREILVKTRIVVCADVPDM